MVFTSARLPLSWVFWKKPELEQDYGASQLLQRNGSMKTAMGRVKDWVSVRELLMINNFYDKPGRRNSCG
jgi:hypothetical protein